MAEYIDKQTILNIIASFRNPYRKEVRVEDVYDAVSKVEPVEMQNSGKWIDHGWAECINGMLISNFECTCCYSWVREKSNFCPNCGADMRGEQDD